MVKWVLPQMVFVARQAIERIRRITEPARSVAAWYEAHPESIYLGASLEHLRNKENLTLEEVDSILFNRGNAPANPAAARKWCNWNKVSLWEQPNGSREVRFSDLNKAVISKLPPNFPFMSIELGLKYSEALFTCRLNELHATRPPSNCLIEALTGDKVNERLGTGSAYGKQSVFERLDVGSNDGSPLNITTHMFRHYLNTLAHRVNLSDEDIALWSGRKDIEQNAAYDHTTSEERVELLRQALPQSSNLPTVIKQFVAIPRDKFGRLLTRTAHTTDLGYCIHDYAMAPCQLHRDCINCEEQICVKRGDEKSVCLQAKLSEAELLLTRAEEATKEGYAGADRWMEHHLLTLQRLQQLAGLMSHPEIADGAIIKLSIPNMASPHALASEDRKALLRYTNTDASEATEAEGSGEDDSIAELRAALFSMGAM